MTQITPSSITSGRSSISGRISTPRADGTKRAFFLDGDDIFVAAEGELVKKRYRVVQIGVNSVIMEDTEFKNNRQTLVIQQEQAAG